METVEIAAFCDVIEESAQRAAKEFGVPDAKVVTDYNDLVTMDDIDVVYVS